MEKDPQCQPGLGSGSSGRVNLAPSSSAPSAPVKLRALLGASKAERLCSSQGREHRELMSPLRGKFGVRGDKTQLRVPESLRKQSWCLLI